MFAASSTRKTPPRYSGVRVRRILAAVLRSPAFSVLTAFSLVALAGAQTALQPQPTGTPAPKAAGQTPAPAQQKPEPVTTTVVVYGEVQDNYLPEAITAGTLTAEPLQQVPLSASVVTRDLLNDQVARLLSDVVKNDASVGDDYVPVGYYGVYQIRGFPLDLATGFEINGLTIAGEQDVPLENKERVEILKGIAAVESGVASAGGIINYVTKRPADIHDLDLATDHRGSSYGAVDLGHLFGGRKQVGVRLNLAGERIVPYMNDTNGWRAMGAAAVDWRITPATVLKGDFEYQHKTERDGSGYQLLGGTTLPDINRIYRSTMLGDQSWGLPDTYDTFNTSARLDHNFSPAWAEYASAGLSHSLIQDNVLYVYGCYYEDACNTGSAPYPWFFSPDGTYDVYDYRNPNELRIDAEAEAMLMGRIKSGVLTHDLAFGGELFLRSVQQPGFFSVQNPYDPSGIVQDGAVYTYIGSDNIYQPIPALSPPGSPNSLEPEVQSAGPRRLWIDSHQAAVILQDRMHLPGRIQLIAAARYDDLHDHNYSAYASCADFSAPSACAPDLKDKPAWLPNFAITFNPAERLTLYANYAVMLSLGPQAPFWTDNGSQFLAPFFTRQIEIGAKYEPGSRILLTGAYFHMRAPFYYPKLITAPDATCGIDLFDPTLPSQLCFESEGRETHNGGEFNVEGRAANWLRLNGSAAILSATSANTGTSSFDNKQVINVPRLHATLFADLTVPKVSGVHLLPGWSCTSRKDATRDDTISVSGYNIFNLGVRYTPGGEKGRVTFHIFANNITNRHYWSDTGASYGDTYLWLGAPPTVRLDAHYSF